MYLVVGLGNPGKQYEATRHNMGFDTVDRLVEDYNVPQGGVKFNAMYGKTMIGGEKVILMKPLSFMNLSGGPVREMANYFKIDPESELIVIYDDIDLEPGCNTSSYILRIILEIHSKNSFCRTILSDLVIHLLTLLWIRH